MKSRILLTASLLLFFSTVISIYGCLQPIGRSTVGQRLQIEGVSTAEFMKNFVSHNDRVYWEKVQADLKGKGPGSPLFSNHNNLAVALIHLGQVNEAIKILEDLEKKAPGQYYTAANLGTAFELNGENQKALNWIKEGIKRKKESHYGTEWLHVKILEAKLAMEKEPDWLKQNSVLGIDFGNGQSPQQIGLPTDYIGQQKTLPEIEEALVYQLHERLEFVKPPEPIVADLLADLSKVFTLRRTDEHAKAIKELSLSYGAVSEEIESSQTVPKIENKASKNYIFYGILGVAATILAMGLFYALNRKRKIL